MAILSNPTKAPNLPKTHGSKLVLSGSLITPKGIAFILGSVEKIDSLVFPKTSLMKKETLKKLAGYASVATLKTVARSIFQ
ncbi:MAG: hypothetical protein HRT71_08420 [Flavobacteriales bacterium]|nr:hypothetical protein [Flavobacteriales bacterium]